MNHESSIIYSKIRRNDLIDLMLDAVVDDNKEIDEVLNWKIVDHFTSDL